MKYDLPTGTHKRETIMPSFDFITSNELRKSLEADFKEMQNCMETGSWKCAQVVAGSIVEALLVDSLIELPNLKRGGKEPLSMDLSDAIAVCRAEKILSDRTADLCSVVRSYRNLIHPGRVVRLAEPLPERGSASIALSLVEVIAEELGRVRIEKVGIRAEQILSKLERDASSLTILKHLILEANDRQRTRLLLEIIPQAHARYYDPYEIENEICDRLVAAYKITLDNVSSSTKESVAAEYVRVLREEDGDYVERYTDAFFRAWLLEHVATQHLTMVREHLLDSAPTIHSFRSIRMIEGLYPFLVPSEAAKWLDPIVRTLISTDPKLAVLQSLVKTKLLNPFFSPAVDDGLEKALKERLESWKRTFEKNGQPERVAVLEYIADQLVFL
jgi:hypothetical protein